MKELDRATLDNINGGEDGAFYKDVAYGVGYAYQSVANWLEVVSFAVGRKGWWLE